MGQDDDGDDDLLEEKEETIAEMDSYVDSGSPSSNYGGDSYANVEFDFDVEIAYFFFELDDEPDDWEEAELSFDFWGISNTMDVNMYLVGNGWEESGIVWTNRPKIGTLIETFTVSNDGIYDFDVSDIVEDLIDDDEEEFSICFNTTDSGYFYITTEEGYIDDEEAPKLIWTYQLVPEIDPQLIMVGIIVAIVAGVIALAIGLYFGVIRKKKLVGPPKTPIQPPVEESILESAPAQPVIEEPLAKFCPLCGATLETDTTFCSNCGSKID